MALAQEPNSEPSLLSSMLCLCLPASRQVVACLPYHCQHSVLLSSSSRQSTVQSVYGYWVVRHHIVLAITTRYISKEFVSLFRAVYLPRPCRVYLSTSHRIPSAINNATPTTQVRVSFFSLPFSIRAPGVQWHADPLPPTWSCRVCINNARPSQNPIVGARRQPNQDSLLAGATHGQKKQHKRRKRKPCDFMSPPTTHRLAHPLIRRGAPPPLCSGARCLLCLVTGVTVSRPTSTSTPTASLFQDRGRDQRCHIWLSATKPSPDALEGAWPHGASKWRGGQPT